MFTGNTRGMYVPEGILREQFDPYAFPKATYLLCELRWGNSQRVWKHWVRNDNRKDCHAEKCFLEEIFEPRSSKFCYITWYLSWSPCATCCCIIRSFLQRHPNVHIDIRVARLYNTHLAETRACLWQLACLQDNVTIKVMGIKDYRDCWETFVLEDVDIFVPVGFKQEINRNRLKLKNILEGFLL